MTGAAYILCAIFTLCGLFSILAGIAGWDWFFNSVNVRMLVGNMRRLYARIIYVVLGIAILGMAFYLYNSVNAV